MKLAEKMEKKLESERAEKKVEMWDNRLEKK